MLSIKKIYNFVPGCFAYGIIACMFFLLACQIGVSIVSTYIRKSILYTWYQPVGKIKIKKQHVGRQVVIVVLKWLNCNMSCLSIFRNFWEKIKYKNAVLNCEQEKVSINRVRIE